ncbi:MAG: TIGR03757 family integrating conjugative element protein [Gammaproteobacteria bacterium]|nr:TIGR03757 family integrating conjugative element protein [Gammaproteobacteria bacterium]
MIRILFIMLMLAAVIGFSPVHAASTNQQALSVEVFTTTDREVSWELEAEAKAADQNIDLQLYALDGIQQFETQLSSSLPSDPDLSKQIALQRIQQLDEQTMAAVQNAAVGLAKAMQYGVDRYPAIVFDSEVVVYGLTDLSIAIDYYRAWQVGVRP